MEHDFDYHHYEDAYFRIQDEKKRQQLKEKLDAQAKAARDKGDLAWGVGQEVENGELSQRAKDLGFNEGTTAVLHLIPLVHVAWADGAVSAHERLTIMQAAHVHGVEPGSEAGVFLASLLEHRPSSAWFEQTENLMRAMMHKSGSHPGDIVELCRDVAAAGHGFMGLGRVIGTQEAKLIEKFRHTLEPASERHVQSIVSSQESGGTGEQ